ncbi:MAG: hypothetical protein U9O82_14090 [Thermodesulfobacteriota bacterium]|nr:hypothetical protein [Thermodesulfobacteriota bacterium]
MVRCDAIELYNRKGGLIVTTDEKSTEKAFSIPEVSNKNHVVWKIITEDDFLKVAFYCHIFSKDSLMGTLVLKKNINRPLLNSLIGESNVIIGILEGKSGEYKVRATTGDQEIAPIKFQDIPVSNNST